MTHRHITVKCRIWVYQIELLIDWLIDWILITIIIINTERRHPRMPSVISAHKSELLTYWSFELTSKMSFYSLLMIVLLVVATTIDAFRSHQCNQGQYLSHDTSCIKYYACENRKYVERQCDFGIWNNKINKCEFSNACRGQYGQYN